MYKLNTVESPYHKICAQDMVIGDIGWFVRDSDAKEFLLLRIYNRWVDLRDPSNTFTNGSLGAGCVRLLPSGAQITLEVK